MLQPPVGYTRADDGVAIAYSTFGDGPLPIVLVAPLIGQLEIAWEEPAFEQFISRLAVGARVVLFDRRGSGLSDHAGHLEDGLGLPRLAADVRAVLDASGVDRAVVFGISQGGATALQFAADHPDRTSAVIVMGSGARITRGDGHDLGVDPGEVDAWIEHAVSVWGTGASVEADGPSMVGNDRYRAWAARLERHTISPGGYAATLRVTFANDARALLPRITAPTLVLHRRDDQAVPIEHGRHLADEIDGATFVELPGSEHTYFLGQQKPLLAAIRRFLDEHVASGTLRVAVRRVERKSAYGYGWDALTPGEREVAALVAQGLTNAKVADRLGASPFTIDGRLRRVFAKLNVTTRVELATEYARLTARGTDSG